MGGSSESDENDWRLNPTGPPGTSPVITVTPLAKWLSTARNRCRRQDSRVMVMWYSLWRPARAVTSPGAERWATVARRPAPYPVPGCRSSALCPLVLQRPTNFAGRFSRSALMPSMWSSVMLDLASSASDSSRFEATSLAQRRVDRLLRPLDRADRSLAERVGEGVDDRVELVVRHGPVDQPDGQRPAPR